MTHDLEALVDGGDGGITIQYSVHCLEIRCFLKIQRWHLEITVFPHFPFLVFFLCLPPHVVSEENFVLKPGI